MEDLLYWFTHWPISSQSLVHSGTHLSLSIVSLLDYWTGYMTCWNIFVIYYTTLCHIIFNILFYSIQCHIAVLYILCYTIYCHIVVLYYTLCYIKWWTKYTTHLLRYLLLKIQSAFYFYNQRIVVFFSQCIYNTIEFTKRTVIVIFIYYLTNPFLSPYTIDLVFLVWKG